MARLDVLRRTFLQSAAAGAAGLVVSGATRVSAALAGTVQIEQPVHGAVLNRRHGDEVQDGLKVQVTGFAPLRDRVTVNGAPARREGGRFRGDVVLDKKVNEIAAVCDGPLGASQHRVRAVWDKHSFPRYRFTIDDNSFFLRDVAQKGYKSLFDCFYLKGLKELHDKYGTKFVLNIYYTTEDGFELPQFPDRYKAEWRDNAQWLSLAFHAHANKPDRPYQHTPAQKLIDDLELVAEQIHRFAGEEVYSPPTNIHWAMVQPAALKPLYEHGVRVLSGGFRLVQGNWDLNYLLDDDRSEYLSRNDALMDFDSGIVFSKGDITCNNMPLDRIVPHLESVAANPGRAEIMDVFTHEQYCWPFYRNYGPDHFQRLDAAIRWVTEHGYKPVFFHEGFLGGPDW